MSIACPNCDAAMYLDGLKQPYALGGFYQSYRCWDCHTVVTVILSPPEDLPNPFEAGSPGAQAISYEEWEKLREELWFPDELDMG